MSSEKTVLWPNLSRFGAALTVASNPSAGTNFLKLSVVDRELFSRHSGLPESADLLHVMRDAGFAYAASETKNRAHAAADAVQAQRGAQNSAEQARQSELHRMYFYSAAVIVKKSVLQQFVPALQDADFVQTPVAQIKHFDHQFVQGDQFTQLLEQQAITGSSGGRFFTLARDRAADGAAMDSRASVNELLGFRDFPPERVLARSGSEAIVSHYAAFNANPAIEQLMVGQSLSPSGVPLKAIRTSAVFTGYASHEDALLANGGSHEGVEEVVAPYSLPLAFEYPGSRLLVLRDARFIEVPNLLRLQLDADVVNNIARRRKFSEAADQLQELYEQMRADDLLDEQRWDSPEVFALLQTRVSAALELMAAAGDTTRIRADGAVWDESDLMGFTALRSSNLSRRFAPEFVTFLGRFKASIAPAVQERAAAALTKSLLEKKARAPRRDTGGTGLPDVARRADAGEKIGGARKDYARRFMTVDEIDGLTDRERVDVVTKDNVWPPLNYAAMREAGVEPAVAYVIRELRKGLAVSPEKAGYNVRRLMVARQAAAGASQEQCRAFVSAVTLVREAVADVKTAQELLVGIYGLRVEAGLPCSRYDLGKWEASRQSLSSDDPFPMGAGWKFASRVLPDVDIYDGAVRSQGLHRMLALASVKTKGAWAWAIKDKEANADADGDKKVKRERPEPIVPHLQDIRRSGVDHRAGRDVDEQMLMTVFRFRAVEYGNWLKNSERQIVLNHAFDAFMDLSKAVRLPPQAIGLGGELAIAFGSRGSGGKSAALAHYEPGRNVINLTRLKGAGSLAHEWGHAFDYYMAKATGLSSLKPVSEAGVVRGELSGALSSVIDTVSQRALSKDEAAKKWAMVNDPKAPANRNICEHAHTVLRSWASNLDYRLPAEMRNDVFKQFALKSVDECFIEHEELGKYGLKRLDGIEQLAKSLTNAVVLQGGVDAAKGIDVRFPTKVEQWYKARVANFELLLGGYQPNKHFDHSRFYEDAVYYDSFRSKPYWSTRVELFARAFESWVQDRIEVDAGEVSQYLVYGKQENVEAEYSGYPRGEDRKRAAERFEALFVGMRPQLLQLLACRDDAASLDREEREPDSHAM